MNAVTTVLAASATTFAATNVDDIFLLTLFFARKISTPRIVGGQYLGFIVILLLSCLGALVALSIPPRWIRLLGFLPLALGIKQLLQDRKSKDDAELRDNQGLLSIALITLSNGADNFGVYVPFFRFNRGHLWLILTTYGVLMGVWCIVGRSLGRHPVILRALDRARHWLIPSVFIGLGVYLLAF